MDYSRLTIDHLLPRPSRQLDDLGAATLILARHEPDAVSAAIRGTQAQEERIFEGYNHARSAYNTAFARLYNLQCEERMAAELVDAIAESANIQLPSSGQTSHAEQLDNPDHEYELIDNAILDAADMLAIAEAERVVQSTSSTVATEIVEKRERSGRHARRTVKAAGFLLGAAVGLGIGMANEPDTAAGKLATVNSGIAVGTLGYFSTPRLATRAQNREAQRQAKGAVAKAQRRFRSL